MQRTEWDEGYKNPSLGLIMCSGYHSLDTELCYTTMCTELNSPKASVQLTHDESNKFPLKSIHINSCFWLTMLPTAPCTSMRNSFFCKSRKIPGEILKPCATVTYKRSFPKKPSFCRAHQHFWNLTLSKGINWKCRLPLVKRDG